jgi:peptidoglycan/LPS O-acetylase OafA/YrhL
LEPSASPRSSAASRLPGLDLLRALAIGWVLLYHASLWGLAPRQNPLVGFGWMGVDLFFVLSGFLIAGQLLRPFARGQRPSYGRFLTRRALRTLPAYLVIVAIYFLAPAWRERTDIQPLWSYLTFTQNLGLGPISPAAFSHAWSLCVEEQFYLVFPLALGLVALRPRPGTVIGAFAAVLVFGMLIRGWFWLDDVGSPRFDILGTPEGPYMRLIYYPTWSRLDGLLAGIAAAAVQTFRPAWWARLTARPNLLLAAGLAGVAASAALFQNEVGGFFAAVFGYPLTAASMAALVTGAASPGSAIGRRAIPGAGALAAGSYSLYLSHKMVFHAVATAAKAWPPAAHILALPLALILAGAAGAALYWSVERPFLKLRERLGGPAPTLATQAPATVGSAS